AWKDIQNGALDKLENIDITKPGITPNKPEWAGVAKNAIGVILETADPAKFSAIVKDAIGKEPAIPERLQKVMACPTARFRWKTTTRSSRIGSAPTSDKKRLPDQVGQ
ncbi:MAG: hypothetical protein IK094_09315, partial [Treponema sp.]|nr:hypothetical protein [Treponema sp.]